METNRRQFLAAIAKTASAVVLAPIATACHRDTATTPATAASTAGGEHDPLAIPRAKPNDWDPIAFNRDRGNAGAIPASYLPKINGADGPQNHLGKHLPYVPALGTALPSGHIALMWGDPSQGHARHPNAVPGPENNNEGHWFNWIEIRKATDDEATVARSSYIEWPGEPGDPHFFVEGGGTDLRADDGKHTVYVAALPPDVRPGDTVRIHGHCLTHGEYVDFLVVPA